MLSQKTKQNKIESYSKSSSEKQKIKKLGLQRQLKAKSSCYSGRGSGFGARIYIVANNTLHLNFQGVWCRLLASESTTCPETQNTKILKIIF